MTVGEETNVNVVLNVFKEVVTTVAQKVVGYRVCRDSMEGSAWWTDEIKGYGREEKDVQENVAEECITKSKCEEE